MNEPVTDQDIKNWRWHFSAIPKEQQTGGDIFIQHCLDTIESLRAELESAKGRIAELVKYRGRHDNIDGLGDENAQLRAEIAALKEALDANATVERLARENKAALEQHHIDSE